MIHQSLKYSFCIAFNLVLMSLNGQITTINIEDRTFGGSGNEIGGSIQYGFNSGPFNTADNDLIKSKNGGYILLTTSNTSFATGQIQSTLPPGYFYNIYLARLDDEFNVIWDVMIGGDQDDYSIQVQELEDSSIIVGACTHSSNTGNIETAMFGSYDYIVFKFNADGLKIWEQRIGGNKNDQLTDMLIDNEENIVLVGTSQSNISGNKTSTEFGFSDIWCVKLNGDGEILWQQNYGGTNTDVATGIYLANDGNYFIGSYTSSHKNEEIGNIIIESFGSEDMLLLHIDKQSGAILNQFRYGNSGINQLYEVLVQPDNTLILFGTTSQSGGFISDISFGVSDFVVMKITNHGEIIWAKLYGGASFERHAGELINTSDGNILLSGTTNSSASGQISANQLSDNQIWVWKINQSGDIIWEKLFQTVSSLTSTMGKGEGRSALLLEKTEGCYMMLTSTSSYVGGDKTAQNIGNRDIWMIDFCECLLSQSNDSRNDSTILPCDSFLQVDENSQEEVNLYPNPATNFIRLQAPRKHTISYNIFDTTGRKVKTGTTNSNSDIDISDLSPGIFLIQLNQLSTSLKFLKD